jgi:hypothetical protein
MLFDQPAKIAQFAPRHAQEPEVRAPRIRIDGFVGDSQKVVRTMREPVRDDAPRLVERKGMPQEAAEG